MSTQHYICQVREVKASKAEKSVVDAEVKLLLELKQKLAAAQGTPGPAAEGKGKKGKKKWNENQIKIAAYHYNCRFFS